MPRNQPPNQMFSPPAVSLGAASREQQGGVRSAAQLGMRGPPLCRSLGSAASVAAAPDSDRRQRTSRRASQPRAQSHYLQPHGAFFRAISHIPHSHRSHSSQSPVTFLTVASHLCYNHTAHSSEPSVTFLTTPVTFLTVTGHIPHSHISLIHLSYSSVNGYIPHSHIAFLTSIHHILYSHIIPTYHLFFTVIHHILHRQQSHYTLLKLTTLVTISS